MSGEPRTSKCAPIQEGVLHGKAQRLRVSGRSLAGQEGRALQPVSPEEQWEAAGHDDVGHEEIDQENQEDDEEARRPVGTESTYTPTEEEVREHMLTHCQTRNWCPHCVKGKGVVAPHWAGEREEPRVPVISIDYACMKDQART